MIAMSLLSASRVLLAAGLLASGVAAALGGASPSRGVVATASMPPAEPRQCPTIDLIPLMGISFALSPNILLIPRVSAMSLKGVAVPWALMVSTFPGETPAWSKAIRITLATPSPLGSGEVRW